MISGKSTSPLLQKGGEAPKGSYEDRVDMKHGRGEGRPEQNNERRKRTETLPKNPSLRN